MTESPASLLEKIVKLADLVCERNINDDRPPILQAIAAKVQPEGVNQENYPYYHFFYQISKLLSPKLIIELGSGEYGFSAKNFACGSPSSRVITIDNSLTVKETIEKQYIVPNVESWTGLSWDLAHQVQSLNIPIDLLYLDTSHIVQETIREYEIYYPLMNNMGVMLFDDIAMIEGYEHFWPHVREPKFYHSLLHHTQGFGIAIKP